MLWSLGLHAAALATTYAWWATPIEPVSFAGNRYVVQLEAVFSEMPAESEIETELELEPAQPPEDLTPSVLPQAPHELLVVVPTLPLYDSPSRDDTSSEAEPLRSATPPKEPQGIKPVEMPDKPRPEHDSNSAAKASAAEDPFAGIEDQTSPDLTGNLPPIYPAQAIRKRLEGVVLLRVCIAVSGEVERVEVVNSSGHAILDRTAVQAVRNWHAHPAQRKGKPIATVEMLPVRFKF